MAYGTSVCPGRRTHSTQATVSGLVHGRYSVLLALMFLASQWSWPHDGDSSRPHIAVAGENLIPNPSLDTDARWSLLNDATFDASTSRTADGSGAVRLTTPVPDGSMVFSDFIPIAPGKRYTYSFFMKTENGPTCVGAQISIHSADRSYLRNLPGGRGGTTRDGAWEEFALSFVAPPEAVFVRAQAYKFENTRPGGTVWVDDFSITEGLGLREPPATKRGFAGGRVRVDALGNFEIKRHGAWTPIFPLSIYSDNYRDWAVYSRQGWNTIIWTSSAQQVRQAQEAVSDFNPEGMLAGFQMSQYTFPSGWAYNRLDDLRASLREVYDQGLEESLLLFYWDNENNHDQWDVPVQVIETIRELDVDAAGQPLRPIYALQGEYNIARVHAARGLADVSGTYVGGAADAVGGGGCDDSDGLVILDRLDGQVSPAAFAQFNGVEGPGDMRLRLYNSIIVGARAIGYWRDSFGPNAAAPQSAGPVDEQAWWPDFPNLRCEVDRLLPLIREPHWTPWRATLGDRSNSVRVGTRDHGGEGYLILVNQTSQPQTVTVKLEGLPYEAREVRDFFDDTVGPAISSCSFSIDLPGVGVASGTRVLRIARSCSDERESPGVVRRGRLSSHRERAGPIGS